jgi:tetraacyldisaccharide 4'-kinase
LRRPGWLTREPVSRAGRWALLPLDTAAWLYGAAAASHRALYERGAWRRARLSCQVVSVGNLTLGGSGKTPMAAWLASALRRRGHRVAIASRGYGRRGREPVEVVSDGRFVRSTAEVAGDEPMLLAAHAPGVPVLVGNRRDLVGLRAIAAFGVQVLVLDDGFQHHRLARDADLVLVDGALGFGGRRLLPRGPLREWPSALSRADAIGVIDGPLGAEDEALIARHASGARRIRLRRRARELRGLERGAVASADSLAGREIGMLCGIANPSAFRATLEALGARVVAERCLPDHHRYRRQDLEGLARRASRWVTTEKDALKILPAWVAGTEVQVLAIEIEVERPDELLDWLETRLRAKPAGRDAALPPRILPGGAALENSAAVASRTPGDSARIVRSSAPRRSP